MREVESWLREVSLGLERRGDLNEEVESMAVWCWHAQWCPWRAPTSLHGEWRVLHHLPLPLQLPVFSTSQIISSPRGICLFLLLLLFVCLQLNLQFLQLFLVHSGFAEWMIPILQMSSSTMTTLFRLYLRWWNLPALGMIYIPAESTSQTLINSLYLSILMLVFCSKPRGQEDIVRQGKRSKRWEGWLDFPRELPYCIGIVICQLLDGRAFIKMIQ